MQIQSRQNNNLKVKKVGNFKSYLLLGICAILAISSIFMTIETATVGIEMSKIEKTETELANQKRNLEEALVKSLSLSDLQEKGAELGFVKAESLVYVTGVASVAKLP